MSERYWGIDWERELPWQFADVVVETGRLEDIDAHLRDHGAEAFGVGDGRWIEEPMSIAKTQFLQDSDAFVFCRGAKCIGYAIGNPCDWSSFYLRSFTVLPGSRGYGIVARFDQRLGEVLAAAGVRRLIAETAADNGPMVATFMRRGWVQSGISNTDRWGSMVQFTRHLDDESAGVFRNQYCFDARLRRGSRPSKERGQKG
jgi:hypothetical protein